MLSPPGGVIEDRWTPHTTHPSFAQKLDWPIYTDTGISLAKERVHTIKVAFLSKWEFIQTGWLYQ